MGEPARHGVETDSLSSAILAVFRNKRVFWISLLILGGLFIASLVLTQKQDDKWSMAGTIGAGLIPVLFTLWQFFDHRDIQKTVKSDRLGVKPRSLLSFSKELENIANTPYKEWSTARISDQQNKIIERLVTILLEADVPSPRACLYEVNFDGRKTDNRGNQLMNPKKQAEIQAVEELTFITHYGGNKPKDVYRQITHHDGVTAYQSRRHHKRDRFKNERGAAGLFEPLTTKNLSRQPRRPWYSRKKHNWQSSVRMPIFVGNRDVELLLTVDTREKDGLPSELDGLIVLSGRLLVLLLSIADGDVSSRNASEDFITTFKMKRLGRQ